MTLPLENAALIAAIVGIIILAAILNRPPKPPKFTAYKEERLEDCEDEWRHG